MITYGLTLDNQNAINEKAKTKKDGCYQFRGVAYRVRDGAVTHFVSGGEVMQQYGYFNVTVTKLEHSSSDYAVKFLKSFKGVQQ